MEYVSFGVHATSADIKKRGGSKEQGRQLCLLRLETEHSHHAVASEVFLGQESPVPQGFTIHRA